MTRSAESSHMELDYVERAARHACETSAVNFKSFAAERVLCDVFRARYDVLTSFAMRFTRNRSDAEDLVQYAFLRACERNLQLPADQLQRWLTTVIRRLAIDRLRQDAVRARFAELELSSIVHTTTASATAGEVAAWICRLPGALQRTFVLWWEGASYQAIALAHGVPIGTVAARVLRAKVQLRTLCSGDRPG